MVLYWVPALYYQGIVVIVYLKEKLLLTVFEKYRCLGGWVLMDFQMENA